MVGNQKMKRTKLIAGNWKMNKSLVQGMELVNEIAGMMASEVPSGVDVAVVPPFVHVHAVAQWLKAHPGIWTGAQDCSAHESGAYTGEVSAAMIASCGAKLVLIGHSERRQYHGETETLLARKVDQALTHGLTPVYCCGETLSEREAGNFESIIGAQISGALFHLSAEQASSIVIAYEPVWAIGTGVTATSQQAQDVHAFIRKQLAMKWGNDVAQGIRILYGGSMKPENAAELLACEDIDGGLIGGAALQSRSFIDIVKAAR